MANEVVTRGLVSRLLSAARLTVDSTLSSASGVRMGPYGEQVVLTPFSPKQLAGDEGVYYTSALGPGATALQLGLSAAFSATAAALVCQNTGASPNGPNVILDRINFTVSVVPTSATALFFASVLDTVNRAPTTVVNIGGTAATATAYSPLSVCTNSNQASQPAAKWYFPLSTAAGAPPAVPAAGGAARTIVGNGLLRGQIPVANDTFTIQFGAMDEPGSSIVTAAPNGASRTVVGHPPVSIAPGHFFLLYLWGPSNATAGIAFSGLETGHIER